MESIFIGQIAMLKTVIRGICALLAIAVATVAVMGWMLSGSIAAGMIVLAFAVACALVMASDTLRAVRAVICPPPKS